MKLLLTSAVLMLLFSEQATTETTKAAEQSMEAAEQEYLTWHLQLHELLLASDNNNHKTLGLLAMINGTLPAIKEEENNEANQQFKAQMVVLNELIQSNELTTQTQLLLLNWCNKTALRDYCDTQRLLTDLIKSNPENLLAYLHPLKVAYNEQNDDLLINTLRLMAVSQYNHQHLYLTSDFQMAVDAFLAENPVPKSAIEAFKKDEVLLSGLTDQQRLDLDNHIRTYLHFAIKMSYLYLHEPADLKVLFEVCKLNLQFTESCLKITQILIHHSDTFAARGIGYALLMAVNQINQRPELTEVVADKQQVYQDAVQCLRKAARSDSLLDGMFDAEQLRIRLLPINQWDLQLQLAEYMYRKHNSQNPGRINPEDCISPLQPE